MNPNEPQEGVTPEPQAQEPVNYAAPEVQESPALEPVETIAPVESVDEPVVAPVTK